MRSNTYWFIWSSTFLPCFPEEESSCQTNLSWDPKFDWGQHLPIFNYCLKTRHFMNSVPVQNLFLIYSVPPWIISPFGNRIWCPWTLFQEVRYMNIFFSHQITASEINLLFTLTFQRGRWAMGCEYRHKWGDGISRMYSGPCSTRYSNPFGQILLWKEYCQYMPFKL